MKTRISHTDDQKQQIAREFRQAKNGGRKEIAQRHSVSEGSIYAWIRQGYGKNAVTATKKTKAKNGRSPKDGGASRSVRLEVLEAVKAGAIQPTSALQIFEVL
jgi:transposase-like protein